MKSHRMPQLTQLAASLMVLGICSAPVGAQERKGGDDAQVLQAIEVTGSRIKKAEIEGQTPVLTITSKDIEATGLGSIGDIIQRLSVSGSSINTKFNSAGNFGFPPDGGGVGSGSTTISLRNLGAKRTLVLVDGLRWVSESSASGVSAAVDLNTLPASAVDRIEILTDGASSLYGSDAIAGVINIITKKSQEGAAARLYYGGYSVGDGATRQGNLSFGGKGERHEFFIDASYFKQNKTSSDDWNQSRYPTPGINGAINPNTWSSGTPGGRFVFAAPSDFGGLCPDNFCNLAGTFGGAHPTLNDFTEWGNQYRFNFAPYNLLLTPSERKSIFAQGSYRLTDRISWNMKGVYTRRESVNQAAPEPIFLGSEAGTYGLADHVGIDVTNPYNPFGFTISPDGAFITRRPLEGGPRVFSQDVDTSYFSTGLRGDFNLGERLFFWDVNYVTAQNKATQTVNGTYNIAHIQRALGPVDQCTAPCVPLNLFGGAGSITPEMLKYISFVENDRSQQKLTDWTANISGDVFELPAGALAFAAGYEHRKQSGYYTPDAIVTAGESNGVPSGPTSGSYSVNEYYLEFNAPILADRTAFKRLDFSVATRYSDYSNFGGTTNNKFGLRWQITDDFTLRSTWAEGFRAPSIGELYGTFSRFDAQITDPCNHATGQLALNCIALGVPDPANYEQPNSQISVVTGGNPLLKPEESKSLTIGALYSPNWAEDTAWSRKLDFELTYYRISLTNAIQASDAQTLLTRCVETLAPVYCNSIGRSAAGSINNFNNTLFNLGRINTSGYDAGITWAGNETGIGTFNASLQTTYLRKYRAVATDSGQAEPRDVGIEVADSGMPKWRSTANLGWNLGAWTAGWTVRYYSDLTEDCGPAADFGICNGPNSTHHLGATTYHDVRLSWTVPMDLKLTVSGGVNNLFAKDPPVCLSCSLNGYDASTYDLPGRFSYVEATIKF